MDLIRSEKNFGLNHNPSFRYIQPNSSSPALEFNIPVDQCGTNTLDIQSENGEPAKRGFENIVVFQNDPIYQEQWDHARMMVCRYTMDDDFDSKDKRVIFKPIVIDMLDVVSIPIEDEDGQHSRVDCWMEITKGRFPHTQEIDGAVKVGSPLSLSVYVKDPRKRTDIRVKDCYAYDDPKVAETNGPALLQLTDFDGCPNRPKLIEVWKRTLDTSDTGATIIAYTTVTAFKFPDRPDLQLTCNIELCRNKCESRCAAELPDPVSVGSWTRTIVDDGSGSNVPEEKATSDTDENKEETNSEDEDGGDEEKDGDEATKTDAEDEEASNGGKDETEGDDEEKNEADEDDETSSKAEASNEEGADEEETKPQEDNEEETADGDKEDEEETADAGKEDEESGDEDANKTAADETDTNDEEEKADDSTEEKEAADANEEDANEENNEENDNVDNKDDQNDDGENDNDNGKASSENEDEQEKEPTENEEADDGETSSKENAEEDDGESKNDEEDEEEEDNSKRAKLINKKKKASKSTPKTSVSTAKSKPKAKKPKPIASKLVRETMKDKQSVTKIQNEPKTLSSASNSKKTKVKKNSNITLTNHMSTTTLRPLKESIGSKLSDSKKSVKNKVKSSKTTSTTTTTTTTTTTSTTVAPEVKRKKKKSKSSNLRRNTRDSLLRSADKINDNESILANHLSQPSIVQYGQSLPSDESPFEMDAMRSFYAYSNFQPQRIHRHRTVRSVDPVKWSNKSGSTRLLGARVISGLEITM